MANPTPVEMIDIATGESVQPEPPTSSSKTQPDQPQSEMPKSWPNEIFVLKIRETPPEGCQATSTCTRENCSCDQETVSNLVTKFCEGLRDVALSRSQMCPHTVADVLKGELNGVFFTWLEPDKDSEDGPVSSPQPSSGGPEKDIRIQAQLYLHSAIYDSLNGNGENNEQPEPDQLQSLGEAESLAEKSKEPSDSDSTIEGSVSIVPENSSAELNTPSAVNDAKRGRRVPSLAEKEVPELEGDAGILFAPSPNSAPEKRLSLDAQLSTDSLADIEDSNIRIESVSSIRVEEGANSLCDRSPPTPTLDEPMEVDEEDLRDKQNTNQIETSDPHAHLERIPGLGDDDVDVVDLEDEAISSANTDKNSENGAPVGSNTQTGNETTKEADASSKIQTERNEQEKMNRTGSSKLESNQKPVHVKQKQKGAPASIKKKRSEKLIQACAMQVAENLNNLMRTEPALQQPEPTPTGGAPDTPLKRKHVDEEPRSLSSSPDKSLPAKKGRLPLVESEDEYDVDHTKAKDVPMEVNNAEGNGQEEITIDDDSTSVLTEIVPEERLIVDYECDSSEVSEASLDNVPLARRRDLQNGKVPGKDTPEKKNTPEPMLNKSKSADKEKITEKEKVAEQQPSSGAIDDDDDDIEVIAEILPEPRKPKENGIGEEKPIQSIHIGFQSKSFGIRKRTSAPVDSQTDCDLDPPTSSTKAPLAKSTSLPPASSEILKGPEPRKSSRQGEAPGRDKNRMSGDLAARKAPEVPIPVIEKPDGGDTNAGATKSKSVSRPPAPPPPIISKKVSSASRSRPDFGKEIEYDRRNTISSTVSKSSNPTIPTPSSDNHAEKERSKTPPLQQQPQVQVESGSTSSDKSPSPVRSRRQIFEEQFDPRNEAMKPKQKQIPKVTKAATESLLQKQPDPLPNIVTSAASAKKPTPAVSSRILDIREKVKSFEKRDAGQHRKGPIIVPSASLQQKSSSFQPKRLRPTPGQATITWDGDVFRLAPTRPEAIPVPSYQDRNSSADPRAERERSDSGSGRENSSNIRNSASAADNIPLEYRYSSPGNLDRHRNRSAESSPRYSTENRDNARSGGRSPTRSNISRFASPPSPNPLDPRLRNRQSEPELTEPVQTTPRSRWDDEEEQEPSNNGNDATPPSSGGGSWERGDGSRFLIEPENAFSGGMERERRFSPPTQNRRHSPADNNDFRNDDVMFDSDQDWERAARSNNQRGRYEHSGSGERREGRHDQNRIQSHHDSRDRPPRGGRGGKRNRPYRGGSGGGGGGYRGGGQGHHQQDSRPYNRNHQGRGDHRGRPYRYNQRRNAFKNRNNRYGGKHNCD